MEEEESSRPDWGMYQLKKSKKSPDKKMSKKAKRLARAQAGKAEKAGGVKIPDAQSKPQVNAQPQVGVKLPVEFGELNSVSTRVQVTQVSLVQQQSINPQCFLIIV